MTIKLAGFFLLLISALNSIAVVAANNNNNLLSPEAIQTQVGHLDLKSEEVRALAEREVVVRSARTKSSRVVGGTGILIAEATPGSFVNLFKSLEYFKSQPSMMAHGRFSAVPSMGDLKGLDIDEKDIAALARCAVGDSDIKLSQEEISAIKSVAGKGKSVTPQLIDRLAEKYKQILLARVTAYLSEGARAMASYNDKSTPINAEQAFQSLAREQEQSYGYCPHLFSSLSSFPRELAPDSESFIYWAKQKFGDMKPVINIVHVLIHRDGERVLIASKQLYSSHYTDAGLSVAELIPFDSPEGSPRTLITYSIRLQVDMLGGALGSIKRRMAQPRILAALKASLMGLRENMEAAMTAPAQGRTGLK